MKEIIRSRDLTAYALAQRAGIDPGVISRFLSGERSLTLRTVDQIAHALGLRLAEVSTRRRPARPVGGSSPAEGPDPGPEAAESEVEG